MPPRDPNLPEGTDSLIDGNSSLTGSTTSYDPLDDDTSSALGMGGGSGLGGTDTMSSDGLGGSGAGGSGGSDAMSSTSSGMTGGSMSDMTGGSMGDMADLTTSMESASKSPKSTSVQSLKMQAGDKIRDAASQGKDKASEALDNVSRLVADTAETVDERLGPQYGDYVRKAAGAIEGLNGSLRGKEVDELFDDARRLVRQSPAIAIGAAATAGFLLVRLFKSGMPQTSGDAMTGSKAGTQLPSPPRVDSSYDPVA